MVVMVVGMCVAHVKGRSLFSLGFRAAVRRSERVRGVPVSVSLSLPLSLHQVSLCRRRPQHELHLLSPWLEEELRVLVRVVHATAVHAGLARFSGRLGEGGGANLGKGSDTVAARKLTLHTNRIHIRVCLWRKRSLEQAHPGMFINSMSVYHVLQLMTSQFVRCTMPQIVTCTAAKYHLT